MYVYIYISTHVYIYIYTYIIIHTYIHYITLHYITLHYTTLHYITLHYITLHYITLHCIALHCIALHTYITYALGSRPRIEAKSLQLSSQNIQVGTAPFHNGIDVRCRPSEVTWVPKRPLTALKTILEKIAQT